MNARGFAPRRSKERNNEEEQRGRQLTCPSLVFFLVKRKRERTARTKDKKFFPTSSVSFSCSHLFALSLSLSVFILARLILVVAFLAAPSTYLPCYQCLLLFAHCPSRKSQALPTFRPFSSPVLSTVHFRLLGFLSYHSQSLSPSLSSALPFLSLLLFILLPLAPPHPVPHFSSPLQNEGQG